ncbi:AbiTii domain-containing protein [Nocardia nova]
MSDHDLIVNLRRRVIDESESLAGLLRTCLMLGATTGSDSLRAWASSELHGYPPEGDDLPGYRQLQLPLYADGWIGGLRQTLTISPSQLPEEARAVFGAVPFIQSLEELEGIAGSSASSLRYVRQDLSPLMRSIRVPPFTQVEEAYCLVTPAAVAGMVGRIRTTLVEMVADMTQDVPFDGLPSRKQVDAAVQVNVHGSRDQYHVRVRDNSGVIGQGPGSSQTQHVVSASQDLANLLRQLRSAVAEIENDDDRADAEQVVADFEEAATGENPQPAMVRRRWRAVQRVGTLFGGALAGAVSSELATTAVDAITSAM